MKPDKIEIPLPYLTTRLKATLIDLVFVFAVGGLIGTQVLDRIEGVPDATRIIVFVLLFVIYEPLLVCYRCTFGQWLMGIRVRKWQDPESNIGLFAAFFRAVVKLSLGWISLITVTAQKDKRAIHDMVSESWVVSWREWQAEK